MKIAVDFKAAFRQQIDAMNARGLRRRPVQLNIDEAIDCLFKLLRTGMQWREVQLRSASYSTLFKHVNWWVREGLCMPHIVTSAIGMAVQKTNSTTL